MSSESKRVRSRPICGIISLALPLAAGATGYAVIRALPEGDSGTLGAFILVFYSLMASVLGSVILAIIALVRREKWWVLPCITLGLDAIALLALVKRFM